MSNISNDRLHLIMAMLAEHGIKYTCKELGIARTTIERYIRQSKEDTKKKKILLFDIETAPMEVYAWQAWNINVPPSMIIKDWNVLCWAAKWLDSPDIIESASWRDNGDPRDDKACMTALHAVLSEADIVVAHNGDKFDIKRVNQRFLIHGMVPPNPYRSIDTLKVARKKFSFTHNKLDFIGQKLGVGKKVPNEGIDMWKKVLAGDATAQADMLRYNVGDIVLLEQVYLAMRAWDSQHPPVNLDYTIRRCTVCAHPHLRRDGEVYTAVSTFASYQCCSCGHWMRGKANLKDADDMNRTMRNAL